MIYTFRAKKMIERVKKESRGDMLDDATMEKINSLDGKKGTDHNWASVVNDEDLVYIADTGTYVARCDCDAD